jgi:hypothetical protein
MSEYQHDCKYQFRETVVVVVAVAVAVAVVEGQKGRRRRGRRGRTYQAPHATSPSNSKPS